MRLIAPGRIHPYFWILTHLYGLTTNQVHKLTGIAVATLARLEVGHYPNPVITSKLRALVEEYRDVFAQHQPSGDTILQRALVRFTYKVINEALKDFRPVIKEPRGDLSRFIIQTIGTSAIRRSQVYAALRPTSTTSIRRQALRLGVVSTMDVDGTIWWSLPNLDLAPRRELPAPQPTVRRPRTPRQRALHDAIARLLARQPHCSMRGKLAVQHLTGLGFSKPAIYRAVKDMLILVETTGYGPNRQTTWSLPNIKGATEDAEVLLP